MLADRAFHTRNHRAGRSYLAMRRKAEPFGSCTLPVQKVAFPATRSTSLGLPIGTAPRGPIRTDLSLDCQTQRKHNPGNLRPPHELLPHFGEVVCPACESSLLLHANLAHWSWQVPCFRRPVSRFLPLEVTFPLPRLHWRAENFVRSRRMPSG